MSLDIWLNQVVEKKASDLFITVGVPPTMKVDGKLVTLSGENLTEKQTKEIVFRMLSDEQQVQFSKTKEFNFAIQEENLGRFRVSAFQQRSVYGAVLRRIESMIPTRAIGYAPHVK